MENLAKCHPYLLFKRYLIASILDEMYIETVKGSKSMLGVKTERNYFCIHHCFGGSWNKG